jgi:hypothetical protein
MLTDGLKSIFQRRQKLLGTFQKTETVDARQFTGGKENGTNLSLWVNSNGHLTEARAEWHDELKAAGYITPERVRLRSYTLRENAYVGDWIILRQNGLFDHMRDQEFIVAGYVQV